jgi:hypothetical protein
MSEVSAVAGLGVRNSQPEGIGRVVALGELLCWNNLGRNVVFADHHGRPRAVFGTTLFSGQDEPSQYDLDVHAILDLPDLGLVGVLNHIGLLRGFRRADIDGSAGERLIEPSCQWWFVADVERTVAASGRLVGSAPRSDGGVGLLVSAPLNAVAEGETIDANLCAADFGEVTGLGVVPSPEGPMIAVGGDGAVALLPFHEGQLGGPKWGANVDFRVATVVYHEGALWVAGPDRGKVDDYDWEQLRGGGFAVLGIADGREMAAGPLPDGVAWGTGGVAVVPFGRWLVVADRTGRAHLVDPRGPASPGTTTPLAGTPLAGTPLAGTPLAGTPLAGTSLGIAHVAVVADRVFSGFNRGGYRLFSFAQLAPDIEGR